MLKLREEVHVWHRTTYLDYLGVSMDKPELLRDTCWMYFGVLGALAARKSALAAKRFERSWSWVGLAPGMC